jgi:hypothetical protein
MHPRLKKVDDPEQQKPGMDRVSGTSPDLRCATETPNDRNLASPGSELDGMEPHNRKPINREKFAYLRAQVKVFRRSH